MEQESGQEERERHDQEIAEDNKERQARLERDFSPADEVEETPPVEE